MSASDSERELSRWAAAALGGSLLLPLVVLFGMASIGRESLARSVGLPLVAAALFYGITSWSLLTLPQLAARARVARWSVALAAQVGIALAAFRLFGDLALVLLLGESIAFVLTVWGLVLAGRSARIGRAAA